MKAKISLLVVLATCWFSCKEKENVVPASKEAPDSEISRKGSNFYFPKDYAPGEVIKITKGKSVLYVEKAGDHYRLEGDILLTQEQVYGLLALQREPPEDLAAVIVAQGLLSEERARAEVEAYYREAFGVRVLTSR